MQVQPWGRGRVRSLSEATSAAEFATLHPGVSHDERTARRSTNMTGTERKLLSSEPLWSFLYDVRQMSIKFSRAVNNKEEEKQEDAAAEDDNEEASTFVLCNQPSTATGRGRRGGACE